MRGGVSFPGLSRTGRGRPLPPASEGSLFARLVGGSPADKAPEAAEERPPPKPRRRPGPKRGSRHNADPVTAERVTAEMARLIDDGWPTATVYKQYEQYASPKRLAEWVREFRDRNSR